MRSFWAAIDYLRARVEPGIAAASRMGVMGYKGLKDIDEVSYQFNVGSCSSAGLATHTASFLDNLGIVVTRLPSLLLRDLKGTARGDGFTNVLPGSGELLPSLQFVAWLHGASCSTQPS